MKKLSPGKRTILAFIALAPIFLYLTIVYPNDARIDPYQKSFARQGEDSWKIEKRFFHERIVSSVDFDEQTYQASWELLEGKLPKDIDLKSARFVRERQLYVPVGKYPYRLDGRDAFFLPKGATIVLHPEMQGEALFELGLWSPDAYADLKISWDSGKKSKNIQYLAPKNELSEESVWFKLIGKWFKVDPRPGLDLASWSDAKELIALDHHSVLSMTCQSQRTGCFVSDPTFFTKSSKREKNIIVILVDTLRRDAIDKNISPNMGHLSEHSIAFSRALSPGNMTSPSTNALLSCLLPTELGSWSFSYGVSGEERDQIYQKRSQSFPGLLADSGYDTVMIGSVSVLSELYGVGIHHGFTRQIAVETDGFDTAQITREAQEWLGYNSSHQFFLYVHLNAPHGPYKAPLRDIFSTWPGFSVFSSYGSILRWLYQAEVRYTDRYIGALMETLKELGLDRNTIIALTADHGDQMEIRPFTGNEAGPDFDGGYFDHGATLLNDEINVPLIIHDPDVPHPKSVSDFVSTLDLGPTLLELGDVPHRRFNCTGLSLTPFLSDGDLESLRGRTLGAEGYQGRSIVFENRYKYIRSYEPTQKKIHKPGGYFSQPSLYFVKEQLYDLQNDAIERINLVGKESQILEKARRKYRERFRIQDGYELVIESPKKEEIEGELPPGTEMIVSEGEATIRSFQDKTVIAGRNQQRVVISLKDWSDNPVVIRVGGREISIRKTSLRLPLSLDSNLLPSESSGPHSLIPYPREPFAYVRRIEDQGRQERKVRVTNPAFESVLREWGYLND
jgi:arylsulfatase A-like enzyme